VSIKPPQILAPRQAIRPLAAVNTLEAEIFEEKAAALGRLTRGFEAALAAWRAAEAEAGEKGADKTERRRTELFDKAAEALWLFVVQREACGLRNTEAVLREYRVPAALRLRMGPLRSTRHV
jgi:Family of unknown function (DUF6665)